MKKFLTFLKIALVLVVVLFAIKGYCHFFRPDIEFITLEDIENELKVRASQFDNWLFDKNDTTFVLDEELQEKILEENRNYAYRMAKDKAISDDLEGNTMTAEESAEFMRSLENLTYDELLKLVEEENARYNEKIASGNVDGLDRNGNPIYVPGYTGTEYAKEDGVFYFYNKDTFQCESTNVILEGRDETSILSQYTKMFIDKVAKEGTVLELPVIVATKKEDVVFLTFSSTLNMDSLNEVFFIKNLARAIGSNCPDVSGVYINVNGEAYDSENWYYFLDENIFTMEI